MSKFKHHASLPVNFEGLINARQPQDVFTFFDDFMGCSWALDADSVSTANTTKSSVWDFSDVPSGTVKCAMACVDANYLYPSTLGGILRMTTVATADYGGNLQAAGQQFLIDQDCGLPLYFETRFRVGDASNADVFIGLSKVDTEILYTGLDDGVGFLLESAVLSAHSAESSAERAVGTGYTMLDGTAASNTGWIRVAFHFDGKNTVSFFLDSNDDGDFDLVTSLKVGTTMDYLPDDQTLTPTIEVITGATETAAQTCDIDYVYCAQQRYHA